MFCIINQLRGSVGLLLPKMFYIQKLNRKFPKCTVNSFSYNVHACNINHIKVSAQFFGTVYQKVHVPNLCICLLCAYILPPKLTHA